jgi:hypothetical protein
VNAKNAPNPALTLTRLLLRSRLHEGRAPNALLAQSRVAIAGQVTRIVGRKKVEREGRSGQRKMKDYPQNPQEWRAAIRKGLGMDDNEARMAYQAETFAYEQLEQWLMSTYKQGYSSDFVPALRRNLKGLAGRVYGNEDEPYWPGSDVA